MTITLVFPPKDRLWLESILKPRRNMLKFWTRTSERSRAAARDRRLLAPFDVHLKGTEEYEKYQRPILSTADLFEVYPHWALRLQSMYEEAEDPTPSSEVGRWAERRKGPRHAYWVTVAAFALAILFGIAGTLLSALQLWVAYCQWQVSGGGRGCGSVKR